jgi:general stress protein 26
MAIGDVTPDGRLRFITRDDSAKLDELTERPQVNVTCQGDMRFLSISGDARLSKDRKLVDQAWQSSQSPWFSEGRDDPHVVALEVIPSRAEFWDRSGPSLFSRVFGVNSNESGHHGDVNFTDEAL